MKHEIIDKYIEATNTHDFDNLLPLVDQEATYIFTDKTCKGIKEVRRYFENAWDTIKQEVYSAKNITCILNNECTKIFIYQYGYEGYHNEKFVSGGGNATNVFQFINGEWKLILEHLN